MTNETNKRKFHCAKCDYESKMPIFICNSCHSMDPKGGIDETSTSPIQFTQNAMSAKSPETQNSIFAPTKRCPHQTSLPCKICNPFLEDSVANTDVAKNTVDHSAQDFFDFFSCPHKFNMDDSQLKRLTNRYREMQKVLHPDVHSAKEETTAAELQDVQQQSAAISDAYRTLRNPYQRALYLLSLHGVDIERMSEVQYKNMAEASGSNAPKMEELQKQEQAMLFHVMEVRETLDESSDELEIKDIITSSKRQIDDCLHAMERAFEKKDLFDARHRTVLLNYLSKIQQEAENKLEALSSQSKAQL